MFEFVGRADRQVKIRGFRVEPGEIETSLNRVPGVAASAVVSQTDAGGHVQLLAYWVSGDAGAGLTAEAIVAELKKTLPEYMVPARVERVRELPLTLNGKIDRKRLQEAGLAEVLRVWGTGGAKNSLPEVAANGRNGAHHAANGVHGTNGSHGTGTNGAGKNGSHANGHLAQASLLVPPTADAVLAALREVAAKVLHAPVSAADTERPMGEVGFDSIRFTALSTAVTRAFGVEVEEARFYELKTLRGVADFLAANGARLVDAKPATAATRVEPATDSVSSSKDVAGYGTDSGYEGAIAIIGLEARLPGAADANEFWRNLVNGVDGVGPMPSARREIAGERGGAEFESGFIADVDKFDAPFFGMSRREAAATDPRQRLFLEAAWRALEDAGVKPSGLSGSRTGVFVGVVGGSEYVGDSGDAEVDAGAQRILGAATSLIAARVSYQLNLHGPSHAIDTACSGSLVALHRAVTSLRLGECDLAIVGGVNLLLDGETTRTGKKTGMVSPTSRCRAFDVGADGYVRGEGVVALVLKPLARALADGDPVHALVRGTAENHGGRAAGLTAPNPEAQRDVIVAALERAGVSADTISYIEAHGTGTQLGDPIEINGLKAAFARASHSRNQVANSTAAQPTCLIGSAKSQIGHLEAAAGLAGLVKVVLAMRAGTIPANLHFRTRNPKIALDGSPFAIAEKTQPWECLRDVSGRELARRAGVSSFGFSGVNAHAVLEEFRREAIAPALETTGSVQLTLSAKTPEALARRATQLREFLQNDTTCSLEDVAATLLQGREAMSESATFAVRDRNEALEILGGLATGATDPRVQRGEQTRTISTTTTGRRIHLPAYPFERRSYWTKTSAPAVALAAPVAVAAWAPGASERRLSAADRVLGEHRVAGRAILPGVAYLDWALAAANQGMFRPCEFRSVVWARAFEGGTEPKPARVTLESRAGELSFAVESRAAERTVHAKGALRWLSDHDVAADGIPVTIAALHGKRREADEVYRFFASRGMDYGPLFRTLRQITVVEKTAVAELATDEAASDFVLHPGLLDGLLQVAALLLIESGAESGLPFTAEEIRIVAPLGTRLRVRARRGADDTIELWATRPDGAAVLTMRGYAVRAVASSAEASIGKTNNSLAVAATEGVRARGEVALGLDADRVERESTGMEQLEMFGRLFLLRQLQERGLLRTPGEQVTRDELRAKLRAVPRYHRLCDSLGYFLAQSGLVEETPTGLRATARMADPTVRAELAALEAATERFCVEQPNLAPHGKFVWNCITPLAQIIDGSVLATDVMFPSGSVEFISDIYDGTVLMDYFNRVAAVAIRSAVESRLRAGASVVRILEVGAGSGATSAWIAQELRDLGAQVEYVFTDISVAFRRHGERRFGGEYPFMRYSLLNIERDVVAQGFTAGSFDVVIGANVLHTIKSLHRSLHLIKTLLSPGGMLVLVEGTESRVLNGLTYGLLDGWWNFEDPERRLPNAPLCNEQQWLAAFREEGFLDARVLGKESSAAQRMTQAVFVGVSDGRVADDIGRPSANTAAKASQDATAKAGINPATTSDGDIGEILTGELLAVVRQSLQAKDEAIALDATFESMGVDSILAVEIVEKLNQRLPLKLRTTDVFNYSSVRRLSRRMEEILEPSGRTALLEKARRSTPTAVPAAATAAASATITAALPSATSADARSPATDRLSAPIAIIGMSGQYADAANLDEFWANLAAGRDCVREVPADRWRVEEHFSPDRRAPQKSYSKWGGFLKDQAGFDPIFFNCSPREADLMDPQQRLFLMECYHALENAGYADRQMDEQRCAVFAGVCAGDYEAQLARAGEWAEAQVFTGNAPAILAGRLPYLLNLKGVGLAVDTACSASLVALHLACDSLRAGSCTMALAGGVAVITTERFYVWASKAGMLSTTGKCRTFGSGADGMVPAEGVGVVVLKLLDDAVRDGDHVHGVILGSGVNQNGRSNGITAPSVPAQAELEAQVYRKFGVDPGTLDYVECHGTGTRLGDPMEVSALTDAFRQWTSRTGFCALGAVKSNIGHSLAAAGVAGVLKVLLALKHREIPATLHCAETNEHLGLADSPFVVAKEKRAWPLSSDAKKRRAAVSAFGFSGANAHAVLEEAPVRPADLRPIAPLHVFTLAAHTPAALRRKQEQLLAWLASPDGRVASVADVSFTLNLGRAHFARRWAVVADSLESLARELRASLAASISAGRELPALGKSASKSAAVAEQAAVRLLAESTTRGQGLRGLVELYQQGHDVNWTPVHANLAGRRIPLPGYPFELRRCWVDAPVRSAATPTRELEKAKPSNAAALRGLSLSAPEKQVDGSWLLRGALAADAPVLVQHRVQGAAILPGVASLELARQAAERVRPGASVVVRAVTWLRPLPAAAAGSTDFGLRLREAGDVWTFAVTTPPQASDEVVFARGEIEWASYNLAPETIDLAGAQQRCRSVVPAAEFYPRFEAGDVSYGPYFKVVREFFSGNGEVLARLELPAEFADETTTVALQPGLMDGALQVGAGLGREFRFPFGAGRVDIFGPLGATVWVYAYGSVEEGATLLLADEEGRVAVKVSGYVTRAPKALPAAAQEESYFVPMWEERPLAASVARARAPLSGAVWLIAREESEFEEALAARHSEVVRIRIGRAGTSGSGQYWHVDASEADAWSRLLVDLPRPQAIYFSTGELRAENYAEELACVQAAKTEGVLVLFRLVKALQARGWWESGLSLKVATRGVWTLPGEAAQAPYFAAVTGFVGSLAREYPEIGAVGMDLGALTSETAASAAAALACEPVRNDSPRIAWRDGRRFEATLRRMEVGG